MFSLILWQTGSKWHFDFLSALAGLLLGILLTMLWRRIQPTLAQQWRRVYGRVQQRLAQARAGVEVRLMAETAVYVQRYHLGHKWANLEQIFVPPRFLLPQTEIDPSHLPDWGVGQLDFVWPELAANVAMPPMPEMPLSQLLLTGQRVVVLAEPGAGKTSLLAYVTYLCATARHDGDYAFLANRLPVFMHLAELDVAGETADALTPLSIALQKRCSSETRSGISNLLQQKARAGQLLLLLDGWDDLAPEQREPFLAWLRRLCKSHAEVHMMVAAAVTDYGPLLPLGFTWTILRPWRPLEVELFAAKWARVLANNPLPINRYWLPGRQPLDTSQRFWMVAFGKHVNAATEPRRQYEQMAMSLPAFFTQGMSVPQQKVARLFWQRLAYTQKSQRKLSLAPEDVQRLADEVLAEAGNLAEIGNPDETGTKPDLLISLAQSQLFIQDANGRFRFLSGVWRDFLAAQYMAANEMAAAAQSHAREPYWNGVLRFYVAQAGAGELARPLLQAEVTSLMRDGLFQVAAWMPEAPDAGEWRRHTLVLLGQLARQRTFTRLLRQRAAAALVQTDESGTMTFVKQLLERSDPFLRRTGVVALSHIGVMEPGEVVDLLQTFLEDGDALVRQTAVSALAWLATPLAEKPLLAALIEGDEGMSQAAAMGLALNGKEGTEILREALEDESSQVRRAAIAGLTLLNEPWVEKALAQIERKDAEQEVRSAAREALTHIRSRAKAEPWRMPTPKQQRWLVEYAAQENRVVPDGAAAQPFLVQVLAESPQSTIRAAAAVTLGHLLRVESIPALETAVRDSDPQVQEAAFTTLCLIHRAFAS